MSRLPARPLPGRARRLHAVGAALSALVLLLGLPRAATADSPLLSARIAPAYEELELVRHAGENGIDEQTCAALAGTELASDVRAAVVQAATSTDAQRPHALELLRCLAARHDKPAEQLEAGDLAAHELFALGYTLGLGRGKPLGTLEDQNPLLATAPSALVRTSALELLETAEKAAPQDFTLALIAALARGNQVMNEDFCQVHREVQSVLDRGLAVNLRDEALRNVVGYIDLYKQDCVEKQSRQAARKLEPASSFQSPFVTAMSFDARGRIAGASSQETGVRVVSAEDGTVLATIDAGEFADPPRWLDGGRFLAFGDWKPALRLVDGTSLREIGSRPLTQRATAVALLDEPGPPARQLLLAGLFDGRVVLYELDGTEPVRSFAAHDKYVSSIVVTRDGKLVTGSFDASVGVFAPDGTLLRRIPWTAGTFVQDAGDGLVLVRDFGDRFRLLDPATGEPRSPEVQLAATLHDTAVHPTRPIVAAALSSGVVSLFDRNDGRLLLDLAAHDDQVLSVAFSADGERMLTGSIDGSLRLWKAGELLPKP